ncbi:hypothetical protein PUMCH_003172 [Australozyma saopauloensis]|uniref:Translation initiation factor eIF2B subunit epsilon n=1 Tax=Australozyma saopauloensis TaxID=291208 RepID=A0AAX4HBP7_9ASCO|nr:hypothetical protein PUMCH_003172 [[Candida] saopauloensis]
MPPKNKKQKELVQDERFQAVVLTDCFETRFMPLTAIKPRCLLPLANVPLIEYTLEFLARAEVNEVYLMCTSHADQIQKYIDELRWSVNSPFTITTVVSLELRSVGDAMRDLDNRGLVTGDFLLVSGDVVTNVDFPKALAFHKSKKAQDKDHIMTMVLSEGSPLHRTRTKLDPAAFVLDKVSNRCHYYQALPRADGKPSAINIDPEILDDIQNDFSIRNDLIDCHIDICSPIVPQIFQENFDYQTLRTDFLKGVLTSDLLKKSIYAYLLDESEYGARVESWSTYSSISQDVLARWCYPLTPDANLVDSSYSYEFNHIYKEDKIILAQSCRIGNSTCIGANTSVGNNSAVSKSVIGRNCRIGANVKILNSYVWDNATIEDNVTIDSSIISGNSIIRSDAVLNKGSVVGFDVVIGAGMEIPASTRIVDKPLVKDDDFFETFSSDSESEEDDLTVKAGTKQNDIEYVGEDGTGVLYMSDKELDEDSELENNSVTNYAGVMYQLSTLNLSDDSIASITKHKTRKRRASKNRRLSITSFVSTDFEAGGFSDDEEEEDFTKEGIATVERSIEQNHDIDTAALELNTLKMSMDVTHHEVRSVTVRAMIKRIVHFVSTETLNAIMATNKVFGTWSGLFRRQTFCEADRVDLIQIIQSVCAELDTSYGHEVLFVALRNLYDNDCIGEGDIFIWWESPESQASEDLIRVRSLTEKFVVWLQEAEEEDSD